MAHAAAGGGLTPLRATVDGAIEEAKLPGWDRDVRAAMTDSNTPR